MRVLVTDGEQRSALAAVRSLGRAGHEVDVAAIRPGSLAAASRFARAEHALGDPARDPQGWAARLEARAASTGAELILPVTEASLGSIYLAGLETRLAVSCPPRAAYERVVDKHGLMEEASRLGIESPATHVLADLRGLTALPEPFRYPVVIKGRRSQVLADGRWHGSVARVVSSPDGLAALRREWSAPGELLLQEYVPGHGEGLFLLAREGRVLASLAHRRLREKPPTGGVSVLREAITPEPELLRLCSQLLAGLAWTGVAMVEFRRTPDGRPVLMEINPRLWGSLQLAVDAGVDFPVLLVGLARGEVLPAVEPRPGVRTRWLLGDLDHLLISLRRREVRRLTKRSVASLLGDFVRSFFDGSRTEVWRRDDPRPFFRELRGRLGPGA